MIRTYDMTYIKLRHVPHLRYFAHTAATIIQYVHTCCWCSSSSILRVYSNIPEVLASQLDSGLDTLTRSPTETDRSMHHNNRGRQLGRNE